MKGDDMSKRWTAVAIVKSNLNLDADKVTDLIAEAIGVNKSGARSYYRWIVDNGHAVEGDTKPTKRQAKAKVAKTKRTPAEKLLKDVGVKVAPVSKSLEEIKEIKAKNLQKMREVTGLNAKVVSKVREELEAYEAEVDEFSKSDAFPDFLRAEIGIPSKDKFTKLD